MTEHGKRPKPNIVLFNINGTGMGHLTTCLAYANRLRYRANPVFFSLSAAMETIGDMGYVGDYLVSRFWSRASAWSWDQQLAFRLGLLFERVRPQVVVFDGTWPFRGLLEAADAYGVPKLVWSNLTLYQSDVRKVPVKESNFDLVIHLGEPGSEFRIEREQMPGRRIEVPPVTLLEDDELMTREDAIRQLRLDRDERYVLFSLGSGNLKSVGDIGRGLVREVQKRGFVPVWIRPPIAANEVALPPGVVSISSYPVVKVMRAFDYFIGAAGYNTCCEVLQTGIPSLFVPNAKMADDQTRRAELVAQLSPAVLSTCETPEECDLAVEKLLDYESEAGAYTRSPKLDLTGANYAADEILGLLDSQQP